MWTLITWPRLCLLTFLTGRLLFPCFPYYRFWKAVTLSKPYLQSGELFPHHGGQNICIRHCKFWTREQSSLLYLSNSLLYGCLLLDYGLMDVYFYTLGHNPILLYLLLRKLFSFGLWELHQPLWFQTYPHQRGVCMGICFEYFLTFWHSNIV